jgi:hypothetical protein
MQAFSPPGSSVFSALPRGISMTRSILQSQIWILPRECDILEAKGEAAKAP